jgi:PAS domain S-box-containing protein
MEISSCLNKNNINFLNTLFEETVEIVIITNKNGLVEWVNNGFEKLTCYKKQEIIGKKPGDLLQGPDTNPETIKNISKAIKNLEPIETDILNYTKYNKPYWLRLFIRPIFDKKNGKSKHVGFIATEVDLTDQYELQNQLVKSNVELDKTIEEKDFFIGILSHDIKNSVGSIYSLSSMLYDNFDKFDKDKILKYSSLITDTSENTLKTLKNIVEISKKNTEQYSEYNLNLILLECLQNLYITYTLKKIIIVNTISNMDDILINTIKINLEIVLNNIISNAINYTPEGKKITLFYTKDTNYHNIHVIDEGIGFNCNKKNNQDDFKTLLKQTHSTGFGLYICKEIIKKMKGKLIIKDNKPSGTIIIIQLPIININENITTESNLDQVI